MLLAHVTKPERLRYQPPGDWGCLLDRPHHLLNLFQRAVHVRLGFVPDQLARARLAPQALRPGCVVPKALVNIVPVGEICREANLHECTGNGRANACRTGHLLSERGTAPTVVEPLAA